MWKIYYCYLPKTCLSGITGQKIEQAKPATAKISEKPKVKVVESSKDDDAEDSDEEDDDSDDDEEGSEDESDEVWLH